MNSEPDRATDTLQLVTPDKQQTRVIDPLLHTAARVLTFEQQRPLTNASGFFFERDERLFLITSRHVLVDEPTGHYPNRLEIELHTDPDNLGRSTGFSIPLYRDGKSVWRQGIDTAGEIDVAAIEIERSALPETTVYRAFTPDHLHNPTDLVEVGTPLLIVGFPLGFHDALHHMPFFCAPRSRRLFVRTSFPGPGLFPDRCAYPSGHEWLACGDTRCREPPESRRLTLDASRRAFDEHRSGQPRPAP